ncbi:MAG: hypothetical protein M5U34_09185 [Chloroflexi bacterium]|nr:hypothetical protein [Chloroflexota bacterium]
MTNQALTTDEVLEALRSWHGKETTDKWSLAQMRLGLQFASEEDIYSSMAGGQMAARNRAILNHGLTMLKTKAPDSEELLRERFEDRRDILELANRFKRVRLLNLLPAETGHQPVNRHTQPS